MKCLLLVHNIHTHTHTLFILTPPFYCFAWLITDNKSLNNTDSSNIKPKVWVETDHQRSENTLDLSENFIVDGNSEVSNTIYHDCA